MGTVALDAPAMGPADMSTLEDGTRRYVGLDYVDIESLGSWRDFLRALGCLVE
ncbi:MAG: hypothetical protein LKE37_05320 [Atopobiaceae bacterium]|jgi:hypothetical protein|nr:hypothetical protein [Atopobiaceae bacterium]